MEMKEINSIPADGTQNPSSDADFEKEFRRIIKCGTKIQICRAIFQDFFTDCSIQGFKYFCERKRHWSERVFWMVMFVIATYLSCHMIHDSYKKWDQTPVIVSLSEKATPVWKVPFPAVTICPEVKASIAKINLTETFHRVVFDSTENITTETSERLDALAQICDSETLEFVRDKNITDASVVQTLNDMSIKQNDSMDYCKWRQNKNCTNLFRPILTEDGICFTFNSLNSQDIYTEEVAPELLSVTGQRNATYWNLERGYNDNLGGKSSLDFYPHRVLGTGPQNGLSVMLFLNPMDLDYLCQGPVQGFKVVLHAPSEIPQPSKNFFRVPLEQQALVSVKPNMVETSKELQNYAPNRKLCYLNSEQKLKFFKVYTQRHCELECLSKYMELKCGCVYFAFPRHKDTPICGTGKLDCVAKIEEKMVNLTFLEHLNDADRTKKGCNCLPACTSITYDIEISQAKFDFVKYFRAFFPFFEVPGFSQTMFASLKIFFKENEFITSKRSELYGFTEFLAACGGLLGLFIGVTALSFVEIFYYFTLRLVWTLRMYRFCKTT